MYLSGRIVTSRLLIAVLCLTTAGLAPYICTAQQSYTVNFTYDAQGRLASAKLDTAYSITYEYDASGNLVTATPGEPVTVDHLPELPDAFALHQSYPNPFNSSATIPYDVKVPAHVHLSVFDVLGRRVFTLVDEHRKPGRYKAVVYGRELASGVYFYVIEMDDFRRVKPLMLVK